MRRLLALIICVGLIGLTGCTTVQEQEVAAALQAALANLTANRALVEQFGREVRTSVDPSDPLYSDLMQSYEDARDEYNNYLTEVELEGIRHHSASAAALASASQKAQDTTSQFLARATRTLDPNSNIRGAGFHRAVTIPESLPRDLHNLPKRYRQNLISTFDSQVRLRSWGKL